MTDETTCKRCGKALRLTAWGYWVDRWLYRTCGGDILHEPVGAP